MATDIARGKATGTTTAKVPEIDFSSYSENHPDSLKTLALQVYEALSVYGFMAVSNIGIEASLQQRLFEVSKAFFRRPYAQKQQYAYGRAEEDSGYLALYQERLDPDTPADEKESFSICHILSRLNETHRWPSAELRNVMADFYRAAMTGAVKLQRVLACALETDPDFFVNRHSGSRTTMRTIYYPSPSPEPADSEQLGAGVHTDYGMFTFLFQDGVSGLEILDKDDKWIGVSPARDKIIINTGDLMERWTNGVFRSTRHRVRMNPDSEPRYSAAIFFDPDDDTVVETLPSCINDSRPNRFPPITAGEHILGKIKAAHH
ncbi:isopenicillin N synthase family dioxygenase [Endozoicomonadaceae bacterium StTr2]